MIKYYLNEITKNDFLFYMNFNALSSDYAVHVHDFSELVIIVGGSAVHVIEGREYLVNAGDIFVINGNAAHGFTKANNLVLYNVMYYPEKIFEHFRDLKNLTGFDALFSHKPYNSKVYWFESKLRLEPVGLEYVRSILDSMLKELQTAQNGYMSLLKCHFIDLVVYISRKYASNYKYNQRNLYGLGKAVAYIENNYTKPITLMYLCEIAAFSERHFDRVFKQVYKITPFEYIIKLRLSKASEILRNSTKSISEVAFACGFSDSNYFSRKFKGEFGVSPKQIRQQPNE